MATIPSLLPQSLNFVEESEAEMLSRYREFGAGLFPRLYESHGDLRGRFRFFRDVSTDDVWAVCETPERQFGVQLDPDIEVICLWDENSHEEIGTWIDAPIQYAVGVIGQRFLTRVARPQGGSRSDRMPDTQQSKPGRRSKAK